MDKYTILIVLNVPLIAYALFNIALLYKLKKLRRAPAVARVIFWLLVLVCVWFVHPIANFLVSHDLTNSTPLSIFDVLLITGLTLAFNISARFSSRIANLEDRFTKLHEELSIKLSESRKD